MTLDDTQIGDDWLRQFTLVDREAGRQLLRSLRLVSQTNFEVSIGELLAKLFAELPDENFALFSVTESISGEDDEDHPRRVPGSSSDRVRSLNENFTRLYGPQVQSNSTIHWMRAKKIKNIVLVEDFIGSGKRLSTYLRDEMSPTIKSWISYGWTKLWIVAYSGLEAGVRTVIQKGYHLSENRVRLAVPVQRPGQYFSPLISGFCKVHAQRTYRQRMPLGFGAGAVGMIFEHSCPNNAPVVLWSMGRKFKPVFPNRGIADELKPLFSHVDVNRPSTVLWHISQYRLALAMLREPVGNLQHNSQWRLLLMLGMASRSGWDDAEIAVVLGVPVADVVQVRYQAYQVLALDPQTNMLTGFGRTVLDRVRNAASKRRTKGVREQRPLTKTYYPWSCDGLVRH